MVVKIRKVGTTNELRTFGLIVGMLFVIFFGVLPLLRYRQVHLWPYLLGGLLSSVGLIAPRALVWPHWLWLCLGEALGSINTRIVLGAIFFLMITPFSLVTRIFGRDPLRRRFEPSVDTYAVTSRERTRKSLEKPY